jgi:hypothetical protein
MAIDRRHDFFWHRLSGSASSREKPETVFDRRQRQIGPLLHTARRFANRCDVFARDLRSGIGILD